MQERPENLDSFELQDTDIEAQGYDPDTGAPVDVGSNWLGHPLVDPSDLGQSGLGIERPIGLEDREDNGQAGPTQENGGLGLGDEEGLGRSGLTESGEIGDQVSTDLGSEDRAARRANEGQQATFFQEEVKEEPELGRDQLDTMLPPIYAQPNKLDTERSEDAE